MQKMNEVLSMGKYKIMDQKREDDFALFVANPDVKSVQDFLNLPDGEIAQLGFKILLYPNLGTLMIFHAAKQLP